ncbi:sigma-70 family RNA polymerase sigma factor [Nocardiopsis sediminis]|uniref:RNA polymerase sigma factor n=1 Tax=Nocardiopsis sediminis TaxID=1778267 RepID=A0ABV8FX89_9ACTN
MDDAELTLLAIAAREGADDAFERLVAETRADVARFIGRMTPSPVVEDVLQETYIRAMSGLPRFGARSSARTWLLSIARHTVVDRYRSLAARPKASGLPDREWDTVQSRLPGHGARFDEHVALLDLLARLSGERRTAFVLTQLDGYSYQEVAEMTAVPVGTVRSRVARARADLVRALRGAERPAPGRSAAGRAVRMRREPARC